MTESKNQLGARGEEMAVQFLQARGYDILERNFKYQRCEIDIIARRTGLLVFVEVKTGRSRQFGSPALRVDRRKEKQIAIAAHGFISQYHEIDFDCRFDVISIVYESGRPVIEHIEEAFWLEEED